MVLGKRFHEISIIPGEGMQSPFEKARTDIEAKCQGIVKAGEGMLASYVALGQSLIRSKQELERGQWMRLWKGDDRLAMSYRSAARFVAIANNGVMAKLTHESTLPIDSNALWMVAQIPERKLQALIDKGEVTPMTSREEAAEMVRVVKGKAKKDVETPTPLESMQKRLDALVRSSMLKPRTARPLAKRLRLAADELDGGKK